MSRRLADDPLSAVDPHAVPPVTRRAELEAAAAINVLAGCWLVAAPFVLDYTAGDPLLVDRLVGIVVAAVGLARLGGRLRASRLAWAPATLERLCCWPTRTPRGSTRRPPGRSSCSPAQSAQR